MPGRHRFAFLIMPRMRLYIPSVLIAFFVAGLAAQVVPGCIARRPPLSVREAGVYTFMSRELIRPDGGILTYPAADRAAMRGDAIAPDDVLAETMGLAMLYFVRRGMRDEFDRAWKFVKTNLIGEFGLVAWKWSAKNGRRAASSASIDDLRLVRALLLADDEWCGGDYEQDALALAGAVAAHEVKDGFVVEAASWDWSGVAAAAIVDLSYLDLYTMRLLSRYDAKWNGIYEKSRDLILASMTGQGLFYDKFDTKAQGYFNTENNLINKLMCAVHLAEAGIFMPEVTVFLEAQLSRAGQLYGRYDPDSGQATVGYDSVAVYALALQLALLCERPLLAAAMLHLLDSYRRVRIETPFIGCFGQTVCHAFDNFQVLLALALLPPEPVANGG
ncbi:MAG: hypothetical protein C4523_06595 [Myxococcales bacterium]|nr:MAG: hypothetical protein C4523_06595 [Myxococcales bacterium]